MKNVKQLLPDQLIADFLYENNPELLQQWSDQIEQKLEDLPYVELSDERLSELWQDFQKRISRKD